MLSYQRPQGAILAAPLREARRFIQVMAGQRQVGKTTMVQQVTAGLGLPCNLPAPAGRSSEAHALLP